MKIVIGSENEPKRLAVDGAFSKVFPDLELQIELVKADSGVSDHPINASDSLKGAINRAKHSRKLKPDADYYVGIEGGLLEVDERFWEHGWVAIENNKGELHTAISAGIEIRGKLLEAIHSGIELSVALNDVHGLANVGQANGYYGLTTDDLITRTSAYSDAVVFALAPFKNPRYFA